MRAKVRSDAYGDSVPATETAGDVSGLITKPLVARAIKVSTRSVDNWIFERKIPIVRISKRCVRFHLPSVIAALRKFEVKEAGAK
jgi:hypothetical protein